MRRGLAGPGVGTEHQALRRVEQDLPVDPEANREGPGKGSVLPRPPPTYLPQHLPASATYPLPTCLPTSLTYQTPCMPACLPT
eukprot:211229-Rhodomonas_salina.3